jgi:UPF0716 family protein affecting phage T7 exclusion
VAIYIALRLIARFYGKSIIQWAGRKAMQRVQKQFEQRTGTRSSNTDLNDGETQVQTPRANEEKPTKSKKKTVGEYIDYEEID